MSTSSSSNTVTTSYTAIDVEKVVRSIQADFIMIASSTRAMTIDKAKEYAYDIELLLKNNYLSKVDVTLMSPSEVELTAIQYDFKTENATGTSRPGGVMWPNMPNGRVRIVLYHTSNYYQETEKVSKLPFKISWVRTNADTSHIGLVASGGRGYSSNGFGTNRSDYS